MAERITSRTSRSDSGGSSAPARDGRHAADRLDQVERGPDSYMAGGSLAQWFDVIVHAQQVTPTQPLPQ